MYSVKWAKSLLWKDIYFIISTLLKRIPEAHYLGKAMVWVRPCVNNQPNEFSRASPLDSLLTTKLIHPKWKEPVTYCILHQNQESPSKDCVYSCLSQPFKTKNSAQKITHDLYTSHTQRRGLKQSKKLA